MAAFRFRKRPVYLFPRVGMIYGLASLLLVLAVFFAVDRFAVEPLVTSGEIDGPAWHDHNAWVLSNQASLSTTDSLFVRQWKGHPVSVEKTTPHRILVMGDSFVWGSAYMSLNHLWWRQLAIELERRGYHDVEVIAVGDRGWSTRRQLDLAREIVPLYQPDLVIWGYVVNDPDEGLLGMTASTIERYISVIPQSVAPNISYQLARLGQAKRQEQLSGPEFGYVMTEWQLELLEGENWQQYENTVAEVGRFMETADLSGFMITLPHFPSVEFFGLRYAAVVPLWEGGGIDVLNLIDAAAGQFGATDLDGDISWGINPNDSHPGPRLTRFYASQAVDLLERDHAEVIGLRTDASHRPVINDWLPHNLQVVALEDATWTLTYPTTEQWMPIMPIGVPAIQLALAFPLPVEGVTVSAPGLESVEVWATFLDAGELYDDGVFHSLGRQKGSNLVFEVPSELQARPLSIIRIRAEGVDGAPVTVGIEQGGTS